MKAEDYLGMAFAIGASDLSAQGKAQNIIGLISQAKADACDRVRHHKRVESKTVEQKQLNGYGLQETNGN